MLVVTFRDALLPALVGLLLAAFPGLLSDREGRPRPLAVAALWACALAVLLTNAAVFAVGDDEVFYLADSWAARNGETGGMLPMRYLIFRPFLIPGLGPGAAVIAGRIATCAMALLAGGLVWHVARRLSAGPYAALAGAVAVIWLATSAEMVFLRPEYFACVFLLLGLTCLVAPPRRFSPRTSVVAGLAMLTLAAATSHRHALFPLAGVVVALLQRGPVPARRTMAWAGAGILAGAAPSLAYVALRDSPQSLWYWNWTFVVHHSWVRTDELSARFPLFLFFVGLAGCVAALWWRSDQVEVRSAGIFWAVATALAVLVPFGGPYALGHWLAVSALLGAILAGRLLQAPPSWTARRILALAVGLVAATPLLSPVGLRAVRPPFSLFEQTKLLDWLREASGGGPVACVAPYHPIKARNAWRIWNAWWYCYLRDPAFNASLSPRLGDMLRSGEPRIIGWDPWPEASGYRNVLAYAVANGLVAADEVESVSRRLEENYRLVRWNRPGPARFGGSRFLVHRGVPLDDRVTVLSGHRIGP
jgi:hypothetical protein